MTRNIAAVTGTRADYGLLLGALQEIQADPGLSLRLMVTGAHLEERFGETWRAIEADGFIIHDRIPLGVSKDSPRDVAEAMGRGLTQFVDAFTRSRPDIVLLLGDRYEMFMAAQAAMLCRLPIAHIHGGERTEGAMDEAFRHAITKMAHLHFATCAEYRRRIIQLGEDPSRAFDVGSPGVDNIKRLELADLPEIESFVGLSLTDGFLLTTYHPVTLAEDEGLTALNGLLAALDAFPALKVIITGVNADPGHDAIARNLQEYAAARPNRVRWVASMGQRRYLGAIKHCRAVVGNSSSGIIEAPSLGAPTVNIGDRQRGRVRAASTIDCHENREAIIAGLQQALSPAFRAGLAGMRSPYGEGGAARKIVAALRDADLQNIILKTFYDLPFAAPL